MDCLLVKDYYNKAVQPYFCSPFKKIPHQLKPPAVAVSDIHLNDQERTLTSNKRWESVQKKCLNQCFAYKHYLYVVCGLEEQPLLLFKATFFFLKKLSGFFWVFWFLFFFFRRAMGLLSSYPNVLVFNNCLGICEGQQDCIISECHGLIQADNTQHLFILPQQMGKTIRRIRRENLRKPIG